MQDVGILHVCIWYMYVCMSLCTDFTSDAVSFIGVEPVGCISCYELFGRDRCKMWVFCMCVFGIMYEFVYRLYLRCRLIYWCGACWVYIML